MCVISYYTIIFQNCKYFLFMLLPNKVPPKTFSRNAQRPPAPILRSSSNAGGCNEQAADGRRPETRMPPSLALLTLMGLPPGGRDARLFNETA
jgi:hypothetical protein